MEINQAFDRCPSLAWATAAVIILVSPTPAVAQACDEAGSRTGGDWCYLADSPIFMTGTVLKIKYNDCPVVCDHDLNIFIRPDPEYAWVARNPRQGNRLNPSLDGGEIPPEAIEAEVHTVQGIVEDHFTVGTRVSLSGWWVEDATHPDWCTDLDPQACPPPKTELHPLRYIMTRPPGQAEKWVIYMAQDFSGRFYAGGWDHTQFFSFGMPSRDTITGEKARGTSDAGVLIETSVLDFFSSRTVTVETPVRDFSYTVPVQRSGYNLSWSQLSSAPEFRVSALLHPSHSPGAYFPFFFTQIERSARPVYEDGVTYSVRTNNAGQKYVHMAVNARLLGTGTEQGLHASYWIVEGSANEPPETRTVTGPAHEFSFTREYGPLIGKTTTRWTLQATATSQGVNIPPNTVDQGGASTRVSVLKQRAYRLEPSWLELQVGGRRTVYTAPQLEREGRVQIVSTNRAYCQEDTTVLAVEHLLPQIQTIPGTFGWSVRFATAVAQGPWGVDENFRAVVPAHAVAWISVTPNAPFENDLVKVTVDPANDHQLKLQWKRAFTHLDVRANVSTDLGEAVESVREVKYICMASASGLDEFFENLYKGLMAIERLRRLGVLVDPIPVDFSRRVGRVPFGSLGEPYKMVNRLPAPYRDVLGGFVKLLDNQPLTIGEWNLLNRFAVASSRIRWSTPAPAGAFTRISTARGLRLSQQPPARRGILPRAKHPSEVTLPWGSDSVITGLPRRPR